MRSFIELRVTDNRAKHAARPSIIALVPDSLGRRTPDTMFGPRTTCSRVNLPQGLSHPTATAAKPIATRDARCKGTRAATTPKATA
jgi:hypothetical protein